MKILVVGAGAIGGFYGARLIQAAADITFLVRPQRADAIRAQGLQVQSQAGNLRLHPKLIVRSELQQSAQHFDLVILSCKAYALEEAMDDLAPALGPASFVLPFLNGLGAYDALDRRFGAARVMGGIAYVATTLRPDGVIEHHGAADTVIVGARRPAQAQAVAAVHQCLCLTPGVRLLSTAIEHDLWEKWAMITAGSAITSLLRGSVAEIHATRDGAALVRQVVDEVAAVANAAGFPLRQKCLETLDHVLLNPGSPWRASMAREIEAGTPRIESDAIVGDFLRLAEGLGIRVPVLQLAYCHLQVYQAVHARLA